MELYCTPKVNTLQLNTVRNSSNTRTRPAYTVSERSLLKNSSNRASCGNLKTLTSILTVRRLLNTRRDNALSGYRSTCTPQRLLGVYIINPPFTSPYDRTSSPSTVALRITSNLYSFSDPTDYLSRSSKTPNPVSMETPVYCCQRNTAACLDCYSTSIVAYLRKPRICNNTDS
jgi:hypothetical protein